MKSIEWTEATPSRTIALIGDVQVACITHVDECFTVSIHAPVINSVDRFKTKHKAKKFIIEQLINWVSEAEEWMKIIR